MSRLRISDPCGKVSSDTESDSDSGSELYGHEKPRKVPCDPFSTDVWGVGNVLRCMAKAVSNTVHRRALRALGTCIMRARPSTDNATPESEHSLQSAEASVSALRRVVQEVEKEFDLAGRASVEFAVGPAKENTLRSCPRGPMPPFS